jgi:hypothetical protein
MQIEQKSDRRVLRVTWKGKHSEAFRATERELDIEGAIRSGKTTLGLFRELDAGLKYPGIPCLICRWTEEATFSLLRPVWRQILDLVGIKVTWHGDGGYDELPNGSRFYFRGLKSQDPGQRYAKFRGLTLARVYLDQAEEVPHDVYLELAGRLSAPGFPHSITMTPNSVEQGHWIAREFPDDNRFLPHRRLIQLSLYDNAHNLPPDTVTALERLYPPGHPKYRTLILGQRGVNVVGEPVYKGAFSRAIHERPCAYDPALPLEEAYDFGSHHPCVVWRQRSPLGQVRLLGGVFGQQVFLDDFLRIVDTYRSQWFPSPAGLLVCCDPAGANESGHGVRDNAVRILQRHGLNPRWHPAANNPEVRLAAIERIAAQMRRRTLSHEEAFVIAADDRWMRVTNESAYPERFLADGFEAGYVWDDHLVSVQHKPVRRPRKDGWYEHGMNCVEYLEIVFGPERYTTPEEDLPEYRPTSVWG